MLLGTVGERAWRKHWALSPVKNRFTSVVGYITGSDETGSVSDRIHLVEDRRARQFLTGPHGQFLKLPSFSDDGSARAVVSLKSRRAFAGRTQAGLQAAGDSRLLLNAGVI